MRSISLRRSGPEVARLLSEYGEGVSAEGAERIHLRSLAAMAKRDYRDVIMAESHPSRTYIIGLLRRGPNATNAFATLKPASLEAWKKAGAIVIGGLCLDESAVRGLYIFTVDSIEAAQDDSRRSAGRRAQAFPGRVVMR